MRFAGALLLALPLLGFARGRAAALKARERTLRLFAELFSQLEARARWRREPLPETLAAIERECGAFGFLSALLAAFREDPELENAWGRAVSSPALMRVLRPEELSALRAFPAALQSASGEAFTAACRRLAAAFDGFALAAGAERVRQTRLWMGLGAFGALLTVIVLA